MSTEPILSIGRYGEKEDLSATEDAPRMIRHLPDDRTREELLLEQHAFNIHERMPHRENHIPPGVDANIPTIITAFNINQSKKGLYHEGNHMYADTIVKTDQ